MTDAVAPTPQDLTVRGEAVERVYGIYRESRYVVNRRYQRKLIWTLAEKTAFIDSIIRGFPVPIILLAENKATEQSLFELIDGMQRLNAVMSFLENEYAVEGAYFDLNTTARTKQLLDEGYLEQKTPVMKRDQCVLVAAYQLPLSIYEFADNANVDEIFRRINSGGRQLSRQELRSAGALGNFADVVRKVSNRVRGDASHSDILTLNDMKKISITNRDLPYGIDVDEVFWVKEGVLSKDDVRQSLDEEQVADIIAYMVSDEPISSRREFLDDYFVEGGDEPSKARYDALDRKIQQRTPALVVSDFQRVIDEIQLTLAASGEPFNALFFAEKQARAPRYFQVLFLAFHELLVKQNKVVGDRKALVDKLRGSGDAIVMQEGGNWGAESRARAINSAVGLYQGAFVKSENPDPAQVHWITQLQNLLSQSYTEQAAYDFKQGFTVLDKKGSFDEDSFNKILKTCVSIANLKKGSKGYVLVGISDKPETTARVEEIYGAKPILYEGFGIVGVEHEAVAMGESLDQLFQLIVDKVKLSDVSAGLKDSLSRHLKSVRYYDKTVFVFEVEAQEDPSSFGDAFYVRHGAQLAELPASELPTFFRRFDRGL